MPQNIKAEKLIKGTTVYVDNIHKFGADAIFLAHFCGAKRAQNVCDFGTGCGIIPLRLFDRGHKGLCVGVDINEDAINLLQKSIISNNAYNIKPLCMDLRTLIPKRHLQTGEAVEPDKKRSDILQNTHFDIITCNPPYFSGGFVSKSEGKAAARHEISLNIEHVCKAAAPLLKDGAKLCICQRPERLADIICAMRSVNIEPKRLQYVSAHKGKAPYLILIEGQKNRAPGIKTLPLLITQNEDGTHPSAEVKLIYEM